ncbi:MAG: hypothetical protein ACR2P5_06575, partial [Gammaproteobacteria bacterium]
MRAIILIAALAGCASWSSVAATWNGHHVNDLVFAWGAPTNTAILPDGRQVMTWEHEHMRLTGSRQCTAVIRASSDGIIRSTEV